MTISKGIKGRSNGHIILRLPDDGYITRSILRILISCNSFCCFIAIAINDYSIGFTTTFVVFILFSVFL